MGKRGLVHCGRRSSRRRCRSALAASASLALLWALAIVPITPRAAGAQAAGQGQGQAQGQGQCARVKKRPQQRVPYWLERCGQVPPAGDPEANAREVLRPLAPAFGLRGDGRDLGRADVRRSATATHVRLEQTHKDVPVYLGNVLVKYDGAGTVQLVNNHTLPNLTST